ncbi:MAG: hypothetical protein NVV60_01525 [Luteimonas sp.]|nr:hypothetical protein [Luteimonas sp.]
MKIRALLIVTLLAGCNQQPQEDPMIVLAKQAIEDRAKDPQSVQYKDVRVVDISTPLGIAQGVCGEFNAKNSMGGYVGFERFAWEPGDGRLIVPSAYPESNRHIIEKGLDRYCIEGKLPQGD